MGWTKRQLIEQAFDELGLASYVFDLTASELQSALRQLDAMIGTWVGKNINIPYGLPNSPEDSQIDDDSGLPVWANETVYKNLALRLAASYGKVVSTDTKMSANEGYRMLVYRVTSTIPLSYPSTMPAGAGNKPWRQYEDPFLIPSCRAYWDPNVV